MTRRALLAALVSPAVMRQESARSRRLLWECHIPYADTGHSLPSYELREKRGQAVVVVGDTDVDLMQWLDAAYQQRRRFELRLTGDDV